MANRAESGLAVVSVQWTAVRLATEFALVTGFALAMMRVMPYGGEFSKAKLPLADDLLHGFATGGDFAGLELFG